ncbi:O-antigen ligase family protein [Bradyrhizobium sp. WYCCWR 12699]|uniref:O-antigen ligase family protein n=1 Tax=Bradyrhizobium sp. WYCCWR 12699 TaxID=3064203 RepID=UPI0028A2ECAA|nr:O-antigen ligase family protein [Bradyrhizobium sp. WYCCWR 12699]MDT4743661.1 O-antigen ligase family protein [Bradyrhizobium sp. WYCCWR 12699]
MQISYISREEPGTRADARLCLMAGATDGLIFLSYMFEIDQSIYYSATIIVKLILLLLRRKPATEAARCSLPFLYALLLAELISAVVNEVEPISSVRILVFSVNLFITLNFVSVSYWRGLVLSTVVNASAYLAFATRGSVGIVYGRYLYFSESHPNLGAEIFFGGAFAALLTRAPRLSLFVVPLFFVPAFLMQGRAAELGIVCAEAILGWQSLKRVHHLVRVALVVLSLFVVIAVLLNSDLSGLANKVLLLDDSYRGEGTGASGRGRFWENALEMFIQNPFFGAGSDFVTRLRSIQPHNFFLYPLAYYGFMGLAVLAIFVQRFGVVTLYGGAAALYLVPFVPMLAFNDRFVNLNVYPTVLFLYVFYQYPRSRFNLNAAALHAPIKRVTSLIHPSMKQISDKH